MFSGSDIERDALRTGVNAFLRKPQDITASDGDSSAVIDQKPYRLRILAWFIFNPRFANVGTLTGTQSSYGQPLGCP